MDILFDFYILQSNSYELLLAVNIYKDNKNIKRYVEFDITKIFLKKLKVRHLRDYIYKEQSISTKEDIIQKLHEEEMQFNKPFSTYFQVELDKLYDEDYESLQQRNSLINVKLSDVMLTVKHIIRDDYNLATYSRWLTKVIAKAILGYKKIKLEELLNSANFSYGFSKEAEIILPKDIKLCKLQYWYLVTKTNKNKNMNEIGESLHCYTKLDFLKNEDIKNEKYMDFQIKYTNIEILEAMIIDQDSFNDKYEKISESIKDVPIDNWALLFLTNAESNENLIIKSQFASANEKIFINSAPSKILSFTDNQRHDINLKCSFSNLDDMKTKLDISENTFKKLKHDNRIIF
ncbi:14595_t:CDS:2, partial [Funneliformis mosseae]